MEKVIFHERALDDLAGIFKSISPDNMDAAIEVDKAIGEACQLLSDNPGIGPLCGFRRKEVADCRFWPVKKYKNYLVLYRAALNGIEVLRVIHGARDFQRFESRLF